jgi:hypothetical protein
MFEAILTRHAANADVRAAAVNAFMTSRTVTAGPYHPHLEERPEEASRLSRENPDERVRAWAAWMSGRFENG